ncbi:THO complex subunit 2 [Balamuthia mandrillaris]
MQHITSQITNDWETNGKKTTQKLLSSSQSLQPLLYELCWNVVHAKLTADQVVDLLLSQQQQQQDGSAEKGGDERSRSDSKRRLGSLLADVFWLFGQEPELQDSASEQYVRLIELIKKSKSAGLVDRALLKERLQDKLLENIRIVPSVRSWTSKLVRINTRDSLTQEKFNVLREESEGYSKLITELNQPFNANTVQHVINNIQALIGYFDLDPHRVLDIVLESFEQNQRNLNFLSIVRRFKAKSLPHILGFKYQYYYNPNTKAKISKTLYDVTALLIQHKLLTIDEIWPHLSPSDEEGVKQAEKVFQQAATSAEKLTSVNLNLGAKSADKGKETAATTTEEPENQKLGLLLSLLESNDWGSATLLLNRLSYTDPASYPPITRMLCKRAHTMMEPLYQYVRFSSGLTKHQRKNGAAAAAAAATAATAPSPAASSSTSATATASSSTPNSPVHEERAEDADEDWKGEEGTEEGHEKKNERIEEEKKKKEGEVRGEEDEEEEGEMKEDKESTTETQSNNNSSNNNTKKKEDSMDIEDGEREEGEQMEEGEEKEEEEREEEEPVKKKDEEREKEKQEEENINTNINNRVELLNSYNDLNTLLLPLLLHLGPYLHMDPVLFTKVCRLHVDYFKQCPNDPQARIVVEKLLDKVLLPALSLFHSNPAVSTEVWDLIKLLPYRTRFFLYNRWKTKTYDSKPALMLVKAQVTKELKKMMRRLNKDNVKQFGRALGKLSHASPCIIFDVIFSQLQSYDNLIQPVADALKYITMLSIDVAAFMLVEHLAASKNRIKVDGLNVAHWLQALAAFAGVFYRKYPKSELVGLLQYVANQLNENSTLELIILNELIANMAGIDATVDLSDTQISALAGGPTVKLESAPLKPVIRQQTCEALLTALKKGNLVVPLFILLAQQRGNIVYNSDVNHLKVLGDIYDKCQNTLIQYVEFLSAHLKSTDYGAIAPSLVQLCKDYHLDADAAFCFLRPVLHMTFGSTEGSSDDKTNNLLAEVGNLFPSTKWKNISLDFYTTFWALSYYDIHVPTESYETAAEKIRNELKLVAEKRDQSPAAAKRETDRLNTTLAKLDLERDTQQRNYEKVMQRIMKEKDKWFPPGKNPKNMVYDLLQNCIFPRALFSASDALYCAKFVEMMHRIDTPYFSTVQYLDKVLQETTYALFCCSEGEASRLGLLLREMLGLIHRWRNKDVYEKECRGMRGFQKMPSSTDLSGSASSSSRSKASIVEYRELLTNIHKWHSTMTRIFLDGLKSSEWMEVRNTIIVLIEVVDVYPSVRSMWGVISESVAEHTDKEREKRDDIRIQANRYAAKLQMRESEMVSDEEFGGKLRTLENTVTAPRPSSRSSSSRASESSSSSSSSTSSIPRSSSSSSIASLSSTSAPENVHVRLGREREPSSSSSREQQRSSSRNSSHTESSASESKSSRSSTGLAEAALPRPSSPKESSSTKQREVIAALERSSSRSREDRGERSPSSSSSSRTSSEYRSSSSSSTRSRSTEKEASPHHSKPLPSPRSSSASLSNTTLEPSSSSSSSRNVLPVAEKRTSSSSSSLSETREVRRSPRSESSSRAPSPSVGKRRKTESKERSSSKRTSEEKREEKTREEKREERTREEKREDRREEKRSRSSSKESTPVPRESGSKRRREEEVSSKKEPPSPTTLPPPSPSFGPSSSSSSSSSMQLLRAVKEEKKEEEPQPPVKKKRMISLTSRSSYVLFCFVFLLFCFYVGLNEKHKTKGEGLPCRSSKRP